MKISLPTPDFHFMAGGFAFLFLASSFVDSSFFLPLLLRSLVLPPHLSLLTSTNLSVVLLSFLPLLQLFFLCVSVVPSPTPWPLSLPSRSLSLSPSTVSARFSLLLLVFFPFSRGVPAVVDLAAMRDAMHRLGGPPEKINPLVDVDLVIDHSVQVDYSRSPEALEKNLEKEMERNAERFAFLKWGSKAFSNMLIVPPGSGIVHQVNLEYLARLVMDKNDLLYPDSLVGTDSHTTMINGLGVVGWGVGGIEAEAVMLGQQISMVLPKVVGFELTGEMPPDVTATDLVLTVTNTLRKKGVVGKFIEFYGPGLKSLTLADRATVANMAPEYGYVAGTQAREGGGGVGFRVGRGGEGGLTEGEGVVRGLWTRCIEDEKKRRRE